MEKIQELTVGQLVRARNAKGDWTDAIVVNISESKYTIRWNDSNTEEEITPDAINSGRASSKWIPFSSTSTTTSRRRFSTEASPPVFGTYRSSKQYSPADLSLEESAHISSSEQTPTSPRSGAENQSGASSNTSEPTSISSNISTSESSAKSPRGTDQTVKKTTSSKRLKAAKVTTDSDKNSGVTIESNNTIESDTNGKSVDLPSTDVPPEAAPREKTIKRSSSKRNTNKMKDDLTRGESKVKGTDVVTAPAVDSPKTDPKVDTKPKKTDSTGPKGESKVKIKLPIENIDSEVKSPKGEKPAKSPKSGKKGQLDESGSSKSGSKSPREGDGKSEIKSPRGDKTPKSSRKSEDKPSAGLEISSSADPKDKQTKRKSEKRKSEKKPKIKGSDVQKTADPKGEPSNTTRSKSPDDKRKPDVNTDVKTDVKTDTKTSVKAIKTDKTDAVKTGVKKADSKANLKADIKSDAKNDVKPDVNTNAKTEIKADVKTDAKPDSIKTGTKKTTSKANLKADIKSDPKNDTKSDIKTDTKTEVKADAKTDVKTADIKTEPSIKLSIDKPTEKPVEKPEDKPEEAPKTEIKPEDSKPIVPPTANKPKAAGAKKFLGPKMPALKPPSQAYIPRPSEEALISPRSAAAKKQGLPITTPPTTPRDQPPNPTLTSPLTSPRKDPSNANPKSPLTSPRDSGPVKVGTAKLAGPSREGSPMCMPPTAGGKKAPLAQVKVAPTGDVNRSQTQQHKPEGVVTPKDVPKVLVESSSTSSSAEFSNTNVVVVPSVDSNDNSAQEPPKTESSVISEKDISKPNETMSLSTEPVVIPKSPRSPNGDVFVLEWSFNQTERNVHMAVGKKGTSINWRNEEWGLAKGTAPLTNPKQFIEVVRVKGKSQQIQIGICKEDVRIEQTYKNSVISSNTIPGTWETIKVRRSKAGDVIGLLIDIQEKMLTLFVNGSVEQEASFANKHEWGAVDPIINPIFPFFCVHGDLEVQISPLCQVGKYKGINWAHGDQQQLPSSNRKNSVATEFFNDLGLSKYRAYLDKEVDLKTITETDLKKLNIPLVPRKRILDALDKEKGGAETKN